VPLIGIIAAFSASAAAAAVDDRVKERKEPL